MRWQFASDTRLVTCVLQCVAVCCSVLQCVAVCCSVLQCVAVLLQCAVSEEGATNGGGCLRVTQDWAPVCCSVLKCVEVCWSKCVAMSGHCLREAKAVCL